MSLPFRAASAKALWLLRLVVLPMKLGLILPLLPEFVGKKRLSTRNSFMMALVGCDFPVFGFS